MSAFTTRRCRLLKFNDFPPKFDYVDAKNRPLTSDLATRACKRGAPARSQPLCSAILSEM